MHITRRTFALGLGGVALARVPARAAPPFDAVIGPGGTDVMPRFPTLRAFLDSELGRVSTPANVRVVAGEHWGQTIVERPNLRLFGEGQERTFLRAGAYAGAIAPDGKPYGTFRSAVLNVRAPGFHAQDLSIENAFDAWSEMRKPDGLKADEGGSQQAIALTLGNAADCATILRCGLASHQDTLFCAGGRALFADCRIAGSYDFIFGGATARFENCTIVSRPRIVPVEGYIAAPSTMLSRPAGLVFDQCTLVAEVGVPECSVFLGRPWRASRRTETGSEPDMNSVGMAAFLRCAMGRHIAPTGWTRMWFGTPRQWFEPEHARFREYANSGPGALGLRRGIMLTEEGARAFSRSGMFGDWTPEI
jgi:pectinesterase